MKPTASARLSSVTRALFAAAAFCLGPACSSNASDAPSPWEPLSFLIRTNYHGWNNSILVSNGRVEAVIVPAIGRVMQFRLAGQTDGPFWENEAMFGKAPDAASAEWGNFGGDKTWPAPQEDWAKVTPRAWPPPVAFDSMPVEAQVDGWVVTLVSAVDPHYGIRTRREIQLEPDKPVMRIQTIYEKVSGAPRRVGVWVITQLKHPVAVVAPLPEPSRFRGGYIRQSADLPADLKVQGGLLSVARDPKAPHKIGTDASSLIWVGRNEVLRIDSPRELLASYPDQESSAEIYTNPDPLPYVELELLAPLRTMKVGDKVERASTYTLLPRTEAEPDLEVRRLLAR
jgi:hypothetical protein